MFAQPSVFSVLYYPFIRLDARICSDDFRDSIVDPSSESLRRVVVVGTSGAGKTTFASELAHLLNVPHFELDAYRHGPNWTETPNDIFRQKISYALTRQAWVVDGNYSVARDIIWPRATTIVWLDYPFNITFWRLFRRTMSRYFNRTELWNGNREDLKGVLFAKDSLFVWAFRRHWSRRKSYPLAFARPEYAHLEVLRFRSPRAAERWLNALGQAAFE